MNVDNDDKLKQEADSDPGFDEMRCPTDICIVCQRKFPRIDSLRRHLISQHLKHLAEGTTLHCTRKTCNNEKAFVKVRRFLSHAATVHSYDLDIGIRVLDRLSPVSPVDEPAINGSGTGSANHATPESALGSATDVMADATKGLTMSGTKTTVSPIESGSLHNIDPRLQ